MDEAAVQALPKEQKAAVGALFAAAEHLGTVAPDDPQQVASASTQLLNTFYTVALQQSIRAFLWALVAAGVGLVFFVGAVIFQLVAEATEVATVSIIAGSIVEVISGLNFYLYGRTTEQLAEYRRSLEQTQRFLLANSIAGSLEDETVRARTRADLVTRIAGWGDGSSLTEGLRLFPKVRDTKTPSGNGEGRTRDSQHTLSQGQESGEPSR